MLSDTEASTLIGSLLPEAEEEWNRLQTFSNYHRGQHNDPYTPKTITPEFLALKERSKTNLVPLVLETLVDRLYVDGYRPDDESAVQDSPAWDWWQANNMDGRQKQVYSATGKYGYSYIQVWPGEDGTPVLRPYSPRAWYAKYDFADDDFPRYAIRSNGDRVWLLDEEALYITSKVKDSIPARFDLEEVIPHEMGVTPLVRFMNSWPDEDEAPIGEVEKVIPIQDRLNQSVFDLLVAQTYQGAPQQYISGVVADTNDVLKAISKRIWVFDEPSTQVGQLPPANLTNLVSAIENALRIYGQISQTPPHHMLGEMVNLSAEALVAAEANLSSKVEERQTLHGESWEMVFRLAGVAANDSITAMDISSQVVWRNTDPRSIAATVDALGKMVQMLHVPPDETWPLIPGVTQTDVARWRQKQLEGDPFTQLQMQMDRTVQSLSDGE